MNREIVIDYKHPMSPDIDQQIRIDVDIDVIYGWCKIKCTRECLDDLIDIAKSKGMNIKLIDKASSTTSFCTLTKEECDKFEGRDNYCPIHGRDIR